MDLDIFIIVIAISKLLKRNSRAKNRALTYSRVQRRVMTYKGFSKGSQKVVSGGSPEDKRRKSIELKL